MVQVLNKRVSRDDPEAEKREIFALMTFCLTDKNKLPHTHTTRGKTHHIYSTHSLSCQGANIQLLLFLSENPAAANGFGPSTVNNDIPRFHRLHWTLFDVKKRRTKESIDWTDFCTYNLQLFYWNFWTWVPWMTLRENIGRTLNCYYLVERQNKHFTVNSLTMK